MPTTRSSRRVAETQNRAKTDEHNDLSSQTVDDADKSSDNDDATKPVDGEEETDEDELDTSIRRSTRQRKLTTKATDSILDRIPKIVAKKTNPGVKTMKGKKKKTTPNPKKVDENTYSATDEDSDNEMETDTSNIPNTKSDDTGPKKNYNIDNEDKFESDEEDNESAAISRVSMQSEKTGNGSSGISITATRRKSTTSSTGSVQAEGIDDVDDDDDDDDKVEEFSDAISGNEEYDNQEEAIVSKEEFQTSRRSSETSHHEKGEGKNFTSEIGDRKVLADNNTMDNDDPDHRSLSYDRNDEGNNDNYQKSASFDVEKESVSEEYADSYSSIEQQNIKSVLKESLDSERELSPSTDIIIRDSNSANTDLLPADEISIEAIADKTAVATNAKVKSEQLPFNVRDDSIDALKASEINEFGKDVDGDESVNDAMNCDRIRNSRMEDAMEVDECIDDVTKPSKIKSICIEKNEICAPVTTPIRSQSSICLDERYDLEIERNVENSKTPDADSDTGGNTKRRSKRDKEQNTTATATRIEKICNFSEATPVPQEGTDESILRNSKSGVKSVPVDESNTLVAEQVTNAKSHVALFKFFDSSTIEANQGNNINQCPVDFAKTEESELGKEVEVLIESNTESTGSSDDRKQNYSIQTTAKSSIENLQLWNTKSIGIQMCEATAVKCDNIGTSKNANEDIGRAAQDRRSVHKLDNGTMISRKRRRSSHEGATRPVKKVRVQLENVILILFAAGRRVHRGLGYEKLFSDYWNAIVSQTTGSIPLSAVQSNRLVLKLFLKTKALRKMHNNLILGILARCYQPLALADIVDHVPLEWRDRVTAARSTSTDALIKHMEVKLDEQIADTHRQPGQSLYHLPLYQRIQPRSIQLGASHFSSSLRIPGSIVIEPLVRDFTNSDGLKVNENVIWVLVIAVREYIFSIIRDTVNFVKQLEEVDGSDEASDRHQAAQSEQLTCISSRHMHAMIAKEPTELTQSLSNRMSRATFERSVYRTIDPTLPVTASDFDPIQHFVTNAILMPEMKRRKLSQPAPETSSSELERVTEETERTSSRGAPTGGGSPPPTISSSITSLKSEKLVLSSENELETVPSGNVQTKESCTAVVDKSPAVAPLSDNPETAQDSASRSTAPSPALSRSGGVGRGAKDLASLLARSKSVSSNNVQSANKATTEQKEVPETKHPDRLQQSSLGDRGASMLSEIESVAAPEVSSSGQSSLPHANNEPIMQKLSTQSAPTQERRGKGCGIKNLKSMLVKAKSGKDENEKTE